MTIVEQKLNELRDAVRATIAASSLPPVDGEVMTLEELLRVYRRQLDMSLQDVANAGGMTKGHVWEIEAGKSRNPTVKCLYGLSVALGLPFMTVCRSALKSMSAL